LTIRVFDILPGVFTIGNLFCGFLAIRYSLLGEPIYAAWLIILATFFDALDGKLAKFAKSLTKFGMEFDSLADVVSFGLAPAILVIPFLKGVAGRWTLVLGFLFLLCGAIRLARFNVYSQGGEKTGYRGLPITMAGGTLAAYVIFSVELWGRVRSPEFLLLLIVVMSALMISTFPYETYPALTWKGRRNRLKIVLFGLCAVSIAVNPPVAFFPLALLYLVTGAGIGLYRFGRSVILNQLSTKNQGDR